MRKSKISRRRFMATTAAVSATMVAAPFVRTAGAAGSLSIGFWDHWVPGANDATKDLVNAWADKEKVEVQMDFDFFLCPGIDQVLGGIVGTGDPMIPKADR